MTLEKPSRWWYVSAFVAIVCTLTLGVIGIPIWNAGIGGLYGGTAVLLALILSMESFVFVAFSFVPMLVLSRKPASTVHAMVRLLPWGGLIMNLAVWISFALLPPGGNC